MSEKVQREEMNIFDPSGPCTLPHNIKNKKAYLQTLAPLPTAKKGELKAKSFGNAFLY